MKTFLENLMDGKYKRKLKWWSIAIACLGALSWAVFGMDFTGWTQTWIGVAFKSLSGGFVGWFISRHVIDLDLSKIPEHIRPHAALSQAILIAGFAVAFALGA